MIPDTLLILDSLDRTHPQSTHGYGTMMNDVDLGGAHGLHGLYKSIWHHMTSMDMTWIWHGYDMNITWIWHEYDMNMTSIWHPYDIHMTSIWHLYAICMTSAWLMEIALRGLAGVARLRPRALHRSLDLCAVQPGPGHSDTAVATESWGPDITRCWIGVSRIRVMWYC